ncbi:hypothetical protein BH23ACT9_BH23ACT9_27900 [soil metagenome]
MAADPDVLRCRTYTHARRFPLVIGKVGGYALPTPLTPAQVVVLLGTVAVLLSTRHHWARLPGAVNLLVAMALPIALAWAVRHATVEGRTPLRFAVGLLTYAVRPRRGRRAGRPVRRTRPVRHATRALDLR